MMHLQYYQETQQYQAYYGSASNPNQCGQPIGNSQLNGHQISSSIQGHHSTNQLPLSSQHGTYTSQDNYHGNGSYGMSSNENSVYPPAVPASSQTAGSSHGYSIPQASAQNLQMVQPHQRAVAQSSCIRSSGTAQTSHVMNNTHHILAQNVSTETSQNWCLSNNSQTNMNVSTPNRRFQMSNGQAQTTVNSRSYQLTQTVQLQPSIYQSVTDSSPRNHNTAFYPCQAQQLKQPSNQAQQQNQNTDAILHYFSNEISYGHMQNTQSCIRNTTDKRFLQRPINQGQNLVLNPNAVQRAPQNIQTNGTLNTNGYAVQPRQNNLISSGMNGQNLAQAHWSNCHPNNGQILRRNSTAATVSSTFSSNLSNSAPVSSVMNGVHSAYNLVLNHNSVHTNQNSPSSLGTSPKLATPHLYTNNSISSAVNGAPPAYNEVILNHNSVHTNQNSPSSLGTSPKVASPHLYTNNSTISSAVNGAPPFYHTATILSSFAHNQNCSASGDISSTISTNSSHVPLGMTGLQSPRSQTNPQTVPSNNMNISSPGSSGAHPANVSANGCPPPPPPHLMLRSSSANTNQTDQAPLSLSSRNGDRAPNHAFDVMAIHGAPAQQRQNSHVLSALQRLIKEKSSQRHKGFYNNTPDKIEKCAKSVPEKHALLVYLLLKDNTKETTEEDNRLFQIPRAVAVVPPISKQTAESDKRQGCDDLISSLMKDVQSLTDGKETEEAVIDNDCPTVTKTLPDVTLSDVNCRTEHDAMDNAAICANSKPLINPSSENKDNSTDDSTGQLSDPHVFCGMPVVTFSLRMVRELMLGLELTEADQGKTSESGMTKDAPDFARAILDLYWGGNYENYVATELGGTFANVLKEAAEFDTDKDVIVFDAMKVEVLNQLYQKGCILTNCSDGNIAVEVDKSSWRNQGDDSLDIDKELADVDFTRQICGSLHCQKKSAELQCDIQTPDKEDSVSEEDAQLPLSPSVSKSDIISLYSEHNTAMAMTPELPLSPSVSKSDIITLYSENNTAMAMTPEHVTVDSHADLKQNITPSKDHRQNDSRMDDKEEDLFPQVQEENITEHTHQNQVPTDLLHDTEDKTLEKTDGLGEASTLAATVKMTNSSSEDSVNSVHNSKDSNGKTYLTEKDCKLSVGLCEQVKPLEKDCATPTTQCEVIPHINLTVLSSETDMVDSENQQDLNCSGQNGPSSPILIRSDSGESDEDSPDPMLAMQITVLSADELKALSVEFFADCGNNADMAYSPISISSEEDPELDSVYTCQTDGETSQMANQNQVSTLEGEEIPSINSINEALSLLQTRVMEKQNNHMAPFAGKEPTSPPKYSRKRKDSQGQHPQNYDDHPSQSYDSLPLKKSRVDPLGDCDNSKDLSVADVTKTQDNIVQGDNPVSPSTSMENASDQTDSSEIPDMPKPSSGHKKRKSVTFKLYGAQKLSLKESNGQTQYYTESDRNLPPLLDILYSPDKPSAREKIKKRWEDSFVPAPIKFRRRSGSESENRGKEVPERSEDLHQNSSREKTAKQKQSGKSSKDKQPQQLSSQTKPKSKHKKHKKRSFSLSDLRREAERMGKSSKSPLEKQKMALHVIKQYKQSQKNM